MEPDLAEMVRPGLLLATIQRNFNSSIANAYINALHIDGSNLLAKLAYRDSARDIYLLKLQLPFCLAAHLCRHLLGRNLKPTAWSTSSK